MAIAQVEMIDLPGAAALSRVSWHVGYNLALSGQWGELERRGRRYFVSRAAVERYITEHATAAAR